MAVRLSALRAVCPLPPGRFLVLISATGCVDPRVIVRLEGLGQLKKSNTFIGNRSHDLPVCSKVPQPTMVPRAIKHKAKYIFVHIVETSPVSLSQLLFDRIWVQSVVTKFHWGIAAPSYQVVVLGSKCISVWQEIIWWFIEHLAHAFSLCSIRHPWKIILQNCVEECYTQYIGTLIFQNCWYGVLWI
jgi:hypothetical protein